MVALMEDFCSKSYVSSEVICNNQVGDVVVVQCGALFKPGEQSTFSQSVFFSVEVDKQFAIGLVVNQVGWFGSMPLESSRVANRFESNMFKAKII